MKSWRIPLLIVETAMLATLGFSCTPKRQRSDQTVSEYEKMGLVEIAVVTSSNRVTMAELIRNVLRTNGIGCVVEGSLEHSVRVPEKDAEKAALVLRQSRSLVGQGVRIREGRQR